MSANIAINKQARFTYHLHDSFEAGMELQGWEVKSLRAHPCAIQDAYVVTKNGELWLFNATIVPLSTAFLRGEIKQDRLRKLLLHRKQISTIQGAVARKGMTCVVEKLYWKGQLVKCALRLATGKKLHDKRSHMKEREWSIAKQRLNKLQHRA